MGEEEAREAESSRYARPGVCAQQQVAHKACTSVYQERTSACGLTDGWWRSIVEQAGDAT